MTSKRQTHPRSFSRTSMLGWDATRLGTYNPDPWMALPEQFSERQPKLFKHSFPPPTAKCTNTMSRNCATTTQNGSGLLAPAKEWKTFASGSCNASRTARVHISSNSYNDFPLSPCHTTGWTYTSRTAATTRSSRCRHNSGDESACMTIITLSNKKKPVGANLLWILTLNFQFCSRKH